MSRRGIPALVIVVVGLVGLVIVARDTPPTTEAVFAPPRVTWMPSVSEGGSLTGTWFCPGVPASGEEGVGGEIVISNRDADRLVGRFEILTEDGVSVEQDIDVGAWSQRSIDVDAFVTTDFAAVVVEIQGGRGIVEQRAIHPDGDSVAPCSNDTSDEWYFAEGYTAGQSIETLIITNPYDDTAVANLSFATQFGSSTPNAFQGFPISPRSVTTIRIADLGARDEPIIAVSLTTESGRVVLGRAQQWLGGERNGFAVSLGAPALRDQFWFADGEQGDGVVETYSIYNPTGQSVEVDVIFLGLPIEANFGAIEPILVPPREVVVFDPSESASIPDGRHAAVFSTLAEPVIVVERVLTRPIDDPEIPPDDRLATTVVLGAPPRPDGYVANTWHIGIGPDQPTPDALVLYNIDNVEGTATVEAVGPAGPSAVAGLTEIPIAAGAVVTIDLEAEAVLGQELIVRTSNRVFVERSLPRSAGLSGRSGSWAVPADL